MTHVQIGGLTVCGLPGAGIDVMWAYDLHLTGVLGREVTCVECCELLRVATVVARVPLGPEYGVALDIVRPLRDGGDT